MNFKISLHSWRDALLTSGLSDRHDPELRRKVAIINAVSSLTFVLLLFMSVTAFSNGNPQVGLADFCLALILLFNLYYLRKTERFCNAAIIALFFTGLLLYYLFISGGVKGTGHLWFFTFPMICTSILGSRQGAIATFLLLSAALLFAVLDSYFPSLVSYTPLFKMRFFSAFTIVAAYTYLFERMRENSLKRVKEVNARLKKKVETLEHTRQALQESETTYRDVVENASDGIVIIQNFRLRFLNPQMAAMLGYSVSDLSETIFTDYLHTDEKEKIVSVCRTHINRQQERKQNYESVLKHKDGHSIAVELNSTLISYHNQTASLVMVRDINQRKVLEENQLKALQAAEDANQSKSAFLTNMSHELRTPLNHIIGFTDLIRREASGPVNDQQQEFLGHVADSSHHLLSIINDILDLSKIEAGEMTVVKNDIVPADLLEETLIVIRKKAEAQKINLTVTIDPSVPKLIFVDAEKMKQVTTSLLDNAIKFTPEYGKISVTVRRTVRGDGIVPHSRIANWLELSVRDTGIGIEEQDQEDIFSSFQQLDSAVNREFQGTGLGLALTRRLLEHQGGYIRVESDGKGHGSRFTVAIPLNENKVQSH